MKKQIKDKSLSFFESTTILAGGATISQFLQIAVQPITARLFTPAAFGIMALFTSFSQIIGLVSALRYEMAIMLPKRDKDAAAIFWLCIVCSIILFCLVMLAILFAGKTVMTALNADSLLPVIWLLPASALIVGIALPLYFWNTRKKYFKNIALVRVITATSTSSLRVSGGFLGYTKGIHLIYLGIIVSIVNALVLAWKPFSENGLFMLKNFSLKRMWFFAKRYKKFPIFSTPSKLLDLLSYQMPIIVLNAFFNVSVVGHYTRAILLVMLPVSFISSAIGDVYFQKAAAMNADNQDLSLLIEKIYSIIIRIVLLPLFIIALIGTDIFTFALGDVWYEAGVFAMLLVPMIFVNAWTAPMFSTLNVLEYQQSELFFNIAKVVTKLAALCIGGYLGSARLAILFFSLTGFLNNMLRFIYILHITKTSVIKNFSVIFKNTIYALPPVVVIFVFKWIFHFTNLRIVAIALLVYLPYIVYFIKHDDNIRNFIRLRKSS